jgi:hypothetical protein
VAAWSLKPAHLRGAALKGEFLGKQRVDSFEGVHFAALDPAQFSGEWKEARVLQPMPPNLTAIDRFVDLSICGGISHRSTARWADLPSIPN